MTEHVDWNNKTGGSFFPCQNMYRNLQVHFAGMWVKCIVVGVSNDVIGAPEMVLLKPIEGTGSAWVRLDECKPW